MQTGSDPQKQHSPTIARTMGLRRLADACYENSCTSGWPLSATVKGRFVGE